MAKSEACTSDLGQEVTLQDGTVGWVRQRGRRPPDSAEVYHVKTGPTPVRVEIYIWLEADKDDAQQSEETVSEAGLPGVDP